MTEVPLVPGTVAEHTTCLLVKLGQVMFRIAENDLGLYELRVRHYSILQALADNGPMSQHALGGYLRIDPATMVTSLDDLETAALAARSKDPKDRRRYVVELTEHGQDIVREANSQLGGLDNAMFADLSPA